MPMRRRPEDVSESLAVYLPGHLDLSGTHCSFEGGMVTLGRHRRPEVAQCFIEGIAGAEIAGGPRMAGNRSLTGREHLLDASDLGLQDSDLGARVRLRATSSSRTTR
jgi:hypothetical protein